MTKLWTKIKSDSSFVFGLNAIETFLSPPEALG
jgi:hypothetical protein